MRRGFEVLLRYQRFDDGDFRTPSTWPYAGRRDRCSGAHSCYAGCSKGLKAVAALPRERWTDEVRAYVQRGSEYFLIHYLYKGSHDPSRPLHPRIGELTFPNFFIPIFSRS